ncbi:MAG: threonine synthase [Bacteroidales bacterium]|nr:MAG: threonine synthase [Bacteroidales bacterium]
MSEKILYYSTNRKAEKVTFKEALLKGLAPDNGLFMPDPIPGISAEELLGYADKPYYEIAYEVGRKFLANEIPDKDLYSITKDAYNFDVPIEQVYERKYIMHLDQGPTASFKDFAARLMGRLMQYFLKKENRSLLILTATSGDTGSAIANAFYELENIKVVVLFPEKEVTDRQRKQMTTLHKNIQIIALNGKFDDCQAIVKRAFADEELAYLNLSSANSINIGRLLPQSMYYTYTYAKLCKDCNDKIIFSVPSGNFGNLMGGLIAMKMGLPVKRFVVSTNENDEVPVYWKTGKYKIIVPSVNCISSAMNVGHPSNMARVVSLYDGVMDDKGIIHNQPNIERMRKDMFAVSIDDIRTKQTIQDVYEKYGLLIEPHGAVGWAGLMDSFKDNIEDASPEQICVCIETAHPAKFPEEIKEILNIDPQLPESLKGLEDKEERYDVLENDYSSFKNYLKDKYF